MSPRGQNLMLGVAAATVLAACGVYLLFTLAAASYTLGCDYLAYDGAARAWLSGHTPYDVSVAEAGDCGTFQYPPPFLLLILPFTLLPPGAATWAFVALSALCVPLAVLAMPVGPFPKIVTLGVAGTSWPVLFAIKVGALGPFLLLIFALAWRWLNRPVRLAASTAVGAFAKVLPALLGVWMLLTRRYRAAAYAMGLAAVVSIPWMLIWPGHWIDWLAVERVVTSTVTPVSANFALPSLLFYRGLPLEAAQAVGLAHSLAVLALMALWARRGSADASLIVAAVASQVIAPVLWDHYATVYFLPLAWLIARRQYWALIPALAMNATFIGSFPVWLWLATLDLAMAGVVAVDWRDRRRSVAAGVSLEATAA